MLFSIYLAIVNNGPGGIASYVAVFALLVGLVGVVVKRVLLAIEYRWLGRKQ